MILDQDTAARLEEAFVADLERSYEVLLGPWRGRPWRHRLGDVLARGLTPIL